MLETIVPENSGSIQPETIVPGDSVSTEPELVVEDLDSEVPQAQSKNEEYGNSNALSL